VENGTIREGGAPLSVAQFWANQKHHDPYAFIHINKCGGTSVEKAFGLPKVHDTAISRRNAIGHDRWNGIFSFAIIRHPYAKVVSHYNYRVRTNQTNLRQRGVTLDDWIRLAYGDRDPAFYDKPLMFAPCTEWVCDFADRIIVDKVIKLEELNASWPEICACAKKDFVPLPHQNKTESSSLQDAGRLLSDGSKDIIHQRFRKDFLNFYPSP